MYRRIAAGLAALFACACLGAPAAGGPLPRAKVTLGDEVFLQSAWHDLHGRCVGVITNQTGVTSQMVSIVDAIKANPRICIKAIYSPEHGFRGDHTAGAFVSSYVDKRTGLPVYSLYGAQKRPTAAMLRGVGVLLFDIQDVGDRPYTFVSTMAYAMQAAKRYHKSIWILDRPNPLGGENVEGPVLDPRYRSFIGLYPIAMVHGMTVGELAEMFNNAFGIHARLRVIRMKGWKRSMLWPDTGLHWVQSSPNIPEWSTTVVYPCTGLLDNAGLSGGIGTTKPFKYAGAPGLDAYRLAAVLDQQELPGVFFRPAYWSPLFGAATGAPFGGVQLVVYNPRTFRPVRTAVEILTAVRDISPQTLHVDARGLDIDWGTDTLRLGLESGKSAGAIEREWQPALERFKALRAKYLLYR